MEATSSYAAFGSIIDIYNFDSTTGEALGIDSGSPIGAHTSKNHILHRAQRKLSSILQTYCYNLAPSPWSPPTVYLTLHRSLESLEDVLHQLLRCNIDDRLGTLGFVTHGLLDLFQEVELLLMSSRVDGPRNERWWQRFANSLEEDGSSCREQYQRAQENIDQFTWAGRLILRVSVHSEYTRRISSTGAKLDSALAKICEEQIELYVWDKDEKRGSFDIRTKFSELAMYQGACFVEKVKLEAVLRVWLVWVKKATVGLQGVMKSQVAAIKTYLDVLKASWLFTVLRCDNRLGGLSDELRAVISLVSDELLFTLKSLQEQRLPVPKVEDLLEQGEWRILLHSGFEDWELEGEGSWIGNAEVPTLGQNLEEGLNEGDDSDFTPNFRYSPIIMRDDIDDDSDDESNMDLRTPLPLRGTKSHQKQDDDREFSDASYDSSHDSRSSLYSVYSNDTLPSDLEVTEAEEANEIQQNTKSSVLNSPDIRSMMSPAAVPQSEYETYEPLHSAYWEDDDSTSEEFTSLTRGSKEIEELDRTLRGTQGSVNEEQPQRSRTPIGSRFQEHFSTDISSKPNPIPDINIERTTNGRASMESNQMVKPSSPRPRSPLTPPPPPPPMKDTNGMLSPTERVPIHTAAGLRAIQPTRLHRSPVGGTMSSAGGHSSAALIKPQKKSEDKACENTSAPGPISVPESAISTSTPRLPAPGVGLGGKDSARTIPAPLELSKKSSHPLARALKTARADIHEKGGWSSLLTPSSGSRGGGEISPGMYSGGLRTGKKIGHYPATGTPITPVAPLAIASGAVVAVNKEVRQPISKNDISSPTPARKIVPPKSSVPVEPGKGLVTDNSALQPKSKTNRTKSRKIKNTAARATANEKGKDYGSLPNEVEILPKELWEMNALVSNTGLPTGLWEECIVRIFKNDNGMFRIVTFRDGNVVEEWINPASTELVPEYAHHVKETVPILFIRRSNDRGAGESEQTEDHGKGRRASTRSSFGCVGDVGFPDNSMHVGAESFYYRFRRLDDMFNFQLAWLGEMVLTDIPAVKSIRYKKSLVGSESVTDRARLQIWKEIPDFHQHGQIRAKDSSHTSMSNTRIVMYWDELICTAPITENLDIEAKQKTRTLRFKPSSRRPILHHHAVHAKIFGRSSITASGGLGAGQISSSSSGAINLERDIAGGFSDEEQFDDFKWFEIEFYEEDEMKWFYQDFMRCQKDRIRQMRFLGSAAPVSAATVAAAAETAQDQIRR